MKRSILYYMLLIAALLPAAAATAQTSLAPDQNPRYMESQSKYMAMADSVNTWHGTTPQETYKAIDYLADKREARATRKATRQAIRMERARNNYWYNSGSYYNGYYYPSSYRYYNPYSYYRNNFLWNTLPLAVTLGWWCR